MSRFSQDEIAAFNAAVPQELMTYSTSVKKQSMGEGIMRLFE